MKSPAPTLYAVSGIVESANPSAVKLLKRLGITVTGSADFGKLWPKGTKVTGKGSLKALKALNSGEYNVTSVEGTCLTVNVKRLRGKRPVKAVVTLEDVTENVSREKTLRESEEKLRAQYKSIPIPTYTWQRVGEDYVLISYNDAAEAITHGNVAGFVGMTAGEMFRDRPDIIEEISRCFEDQKSIEREMVYSYHVTGESKNLAVKYAFVPPDLVLVHTEDITDRKRSEEALSEKRKELKTIFETTPDLLILLDDKFIYRAVNPAFCRFMGKKEGELVGKTDFDVFPPDQAEVYRQSDIEVIAAGEPETLERQVKDADGIERSLQVVKTPIFDTASKPAGMLVSIRDITELRRAEDALKESEVQYRLTIDSMKDAIHVIDQEMRFVLFNSVFKKWNESLGLDTDVVGKNLFEIFTFLTDKVRDEYQRVFSTGEPLITKEETRVGETVFTTETRKIPIFEHGEVVRVVTAVRDITDRESTERALRESEEKYRNLIERSNDAVAIIQDGVIKFANERVTEVFGYPVEELIGKNFVDYIHPNEEPKLTELYERRMSGKSVPPIYESVLLNGDGKPIYVEINAGVIQYDGKPADFAFVRDITERKAIEEALRESEEVFRVTFENAKDAIFWADPETGLIVNCNKAAEALLETERDEIIGLHQTDLHPSEKTEYYAELFKRHIEREGAVDEEAEIITKSGRMKTVHISASLMNVAGRRIIQGSFRDITQLKKVQLERKVVADVNQVLAASLDPSATLSKIFNILDRLFDFDRMSIAILSEDGETFRVFEAVEKGKSTPGVYETGTILPAVGTALKECVSNRGILIVDDLKNSKFTEPEELYKAGLRAVVLLPLVIGKKPLGTWNIGSKKIGAFTEIPSMVLEELSSYLALWLESRLVYEKVAKSEEQYRTLQTNVPVGVFRTTAEPGGHLISTNPALAKMFGYEAPEEMYDVKVSDLYQNPKEREKFIHTISSVGAITDYEVELKRIDGSSFWGSLSARAVKERDGSVAYLDGILEDITERRQAEAALKESEEKYRILIDNAGAPVTYLSLDGTILLINTIGGKNLGGIPDEFVGKSIYDLLPDVADITRDRIRQVVESKTGCGFEDLIKLPSGNRWFNSDFQPVKNADGEIFAIQIVSLDVTEPKRSEEALKESEERYRTLHTNIPVGVFRTTAEPGGHLISTNPALAKMFGYETPEDMYDIRVSDLYRNPKDREKFIETILSAGAITDYEVEFKRTDGSSFWGSLSARAVKESDGSVAYLDGILEDVTERKEAKLALVDSEKKYKALYETTRALSVYADENEVLKSIGEQASILFDAYDCTIYTINRDDGLLEPRYSDSKDFRDEVMSFTVPVGLGVVGHVAETGEGLIVNYDDKGIGLTIPGIENSREDAESVIAVPLKTKDKVTGVIILSRMGEKFYQGDLDALYAFSAQAAVAAERAELLKEIRTSEEKYRTTFENAGASIALLGEDTIISFANRGFELLAGCAREEIEGKKSWTEFVAPYELERMKRYHDERRRPGGEAPDEYEFDFLRPDDSIRRVFLSIAMVPGTKQSVASLVDITELRRAEERYRTTVESTGTAMALVDENGLITFVNKEMERLGGVPREDIENKAYWADFVAREDLPKLQRYEAELRKGEDVPSQVEFRFERPQGGVKHCFLNAALLPGTGTIVVSVLDITDRKLAEEAVERERRAFAIVAEAAAQGDDVADMCKRVLNGLIDTLGFDFGSVRLYDEETRLLNLVAVVRSEKDKGDLTSSHAIDDERYFGALIARTRKELFAPDVSVHETSITHKDRIEELEVKGIVGYPLIGSGDRLIGTMQLVAHNVLDLNEAENATIRTVVEMLTVAIERRLADLAVAGSEEKYRALFEQAGDAVFLETLDGNILEVNQRACDMLGYTKEEMMKMNVADITPLETSELLPDISAELSEKGFIQMEAMNIRKDGKNIPVELNARVIDVGGRKLVFAIVRDISVHMELIQGLKTQANELMELKRAKDTLTDLVVHDIKNISSSMLVWLELLQDGVFGQMSNEQKETVGRVIDNNIQLFDLSQELLDVARSEEGEIKLRKQPFLLDKSVTEATEYYKPTAEKQSKILELEVKDEAVLVFADEERIRRVVSNLITNALKFVEPNEGEVKVIVEKDLEKKAAIIRVSDNGRGIPEKYQEMIFEKFMQVELRDAGFKRGAGLGLTFCKMVVAEHDGDMWVESDGEHGSTFVCSLPLYQQTK